MSNIYSLYGHHISLYIHYMITICSLHSKNSHIRTLNFEGQAAAGSYLMTTISNIRLSGF